MSQPAKKQPAAVERPADAPFGSNFLRLNAREWLAVALIVVAVCAFAPAVWTRLEPLDVGADFRVPYELGNDYWFYSQYCGRIAADDSILVLGDSVIWGEYVNRDATLPHELSRLAQTRRFVNVGVDGIHPAAMLGLVTYYGRAMRGKKIVLQFNPLWMSSDKHDLRTEREFQFNHPRLVPQFSPRIPCYRESRAGRLGIVIDRYLPFRAWMNHLSIVYFDNAGIPAWQKEHPYENPLAQFATQSPPRDSEPRHKPVSWTKSVGKPANFEWVEPETSIQWWSFRKTVETLMSRHNDVFVVVGPFNEHMIKPEQMPAYEKIKQAAVQWLREENIPHCVPPLLQSELYADASHPLAEGYAMLAANLYNDAAFREFLEEE